MQPSIDIGAVAISVITSLIASSVSYGVMKTKIARIEKDIEGMVSKDLFDAILVQVKDDLTDLKSSMRELLELVHERKV